jgi:hypothetical protein
MLLDLLLSYVFALVILESFLVVVICRNKSTNKAFALFVLFATNFITSIFLPNNYVKLVRYLIEYTDYRSYVVFSIEPFIPISILLFLFLVYRQGCSVRKSLR